MNRGILFQPDMVRQILAGKKKQTRRMVKAPLSYIEPFSCPYGQVADTLTVREAWRAWKEYDDLPPRDIRGQTLVHFEADGPAPEIFGRYRHARFMPLHMARIKLTLSSVRVQRLREITEEDAQAEGVTPSITTPGFEYRAGFQTLWVGINGQESWDANPYVWVLGWD